MFHYQIYYRKFNVLQYIFLFCIKIGEKHSRDKYVLKHFGVQKMSQTRQTKRMKKK